MEKNYEKFNTFKNLKNKVQSIFNISEYEAEKIVETAFCTNIKESIEDILKFYNNEVINNKAVVSQINISSLNLWENNEKFIRHNSGKFFEIIGLSIKNSNKREVGSVGWDQPIIRERSNNKGGVLGLIRTYIDGLPHYLVEAKFEPGNYNQLQLSPTLQATFSNLEMVHGGREPNYYKFFKNYNNKKDFIFNNWLTEDGGRLYKKRNLGLIKQVEYKKIGNLNEGFVYVSLFQLRQLAIEKSIVNPHLMRLMQF